MRIYNNTGISEKQKQIQEMVEFVPKAERSSGLTKGALSTQLMQRLSQHPSVGQSDKIKTLNYLFEANLGVVNLFRAIFH